MISYIVASHDHSVLEANLRSADLLGYGDELIVISDATSIAKAYNDGQARATNRVRCYIHHDVAVLDPTRLRDKLIDTCTRRVGVVGVIGSRDRRVPWWEGDTLGSVVDARMGLLDFGPGGECSYLDGLLLATAHDDLAWDESYDGFHLYDHDICEQMLRRGLSNYCLDRGAELVRHNTTNSSDTAQLNGWDAGVAHFREKWPIAA